ncbi:MAG: type II secretory pathway pseudopilin PulG [Verrucomicrobiales bacterium]|jgi:type II secretory pathway pseudopilin PulG
MRVSGSKRPVGGFTLLELTLAIGVLALLTAGIFGLATGSIELTNELGEQSQVQLARQRLVELCRRNLESLPASAAIEIRPTTHDFAPNEIAFHNHPVAFRFGGAVTLPSTVVLSSRPDGGGGFMIRSHYLEMNDALKYRKGVEVDSLSESPALALIRGIHSFKWEFYEARTDEWLDEWKLENGRPGFVALNLRMLGEIEASRHVFWLPPRARPPQFQAPAPPTDGTEPVDPENPEAPADPAAPAPETENPNL